MKKLQLISTCVLIITLLVMGVNIFVASLPDWVLRIDGILMLIGLLAVSFSTIRCLKRDK